MPSLANSAWIRGAPQSGFAVGIGRTSARKWTNSWLDGLGASVVRAGSNIDEAIGGAIGPRCRAARLSRRSASPANPWRGGPRTVGPPNGAADVSPFASARPTADGARGSPARLPSYLHGHSALSRASSRHPAGKRGHGRATRIPDTVLAVTGTTARSASPGQSGPDGGGRRSRWSEGGQLSVIRRPRRSRGRSRRPPIGWP
jgi:hypothetical protein